MNKNKLITILTALFWALCIAVWHFYDPAAKFTRNEPGADHRPAGNARKADDVLIGEYFQAAPTPPLPSPQGEGDAWPGFRGADRSNVSTERLSLIDGDFPVEWRLETGEGHAAAAIADGRVFFLDYDEKLSSDALRCIDLRTGQELWRRWYRVVMKRNHGFSRTIPVLSDGKVVSIGPEGHVMCCDQQSGALLWTKDMKKEFSTEIPFWYTGQCPLVEGGRLVLAPAGEEVLMCGIDIATGETVWTTPNEPKFKMSHSSVMPMTIGGRRTLVYAAVGGVCGVSAEKEDEGRLLWSQTKWQPSVIAPSPLQLSDSRIFLVAGYGAGGAVLEVTRNGSGWRAEIVEQYKADKGLSSEQQTPILLNGKILTIVPKDGGSLRERLAMFDPSDLHRAVWNSAAEERFGLGPYVAIGTHLFALKEDGTLFVYHVEKSSLSLLRRQAIIDDGADAWGPMAYSDGRLVLRDSKQLVCIRVKDGGS